LLPSLGRARERAKTSRCLANVRGMSTSLNLYMADYQRMIPYYNIGSSFWSKLLIPYGASDKIRDCPSAMTTNFTGGASGGSASSQWSGFATPPTDSGAYGINGWIYNPVGPYADSNGKGYNFPVTRDNSLVPLVCDSAWPDGWPMASDTGNTTVDTQANPTGLSTNSNFMKRYCISRHGKSVNVGALDGHAENVMLKQLWSFKWHSAWVVPSPLPNIP
jgi:prepilin-type processing-associated H-X9-DG protein